MIKIKRKIITCSNEEDDYFWIEKTTYIFGCRIWISIVGQYEDEERGWIPFTSREEAEEQIKKK